MLRLRPAAPRTRTDSQPVVVHRLRGSRLRCGRTLRRSVEQRRAGIHRRQLAGGRTPEVLAELRSAGRGVRSCASPVLPCDLLRRFARRRCRCGEPSRRTKRSGRRCPEAIPRAVAAPRRQPSCQRRRRMGTKCGRSLAQYPMPRVAVCRTTGESPVGRSPHVGATRARLRRGLNRRVACSRSHTCRASQMRLCRDR